jgi:hypothetical protein
MYAASLIFNFTVSVEANIIVFEFFYVNLQGQNQPLTMHVGYYAFTD